MKSFEPNGIVTLTSDFGTVDGYVGAIKGVILSFFPKAHVVDITHAVPPQDVRAGARALENSCPYFPEGTVHVAVVDPGVGTNRAAVVVLHGGHAWVAPDNGVLSGVVPAGAQAWRIEQKALMREPISRTFHGRDVFGPVAAALAEGTTTPEDVGPHQRLKRLPEPTLQRGGDFVRGEVVAVDRFGNLVTNIAVSLLPTEEHFAGLRVDAGRISIDSLSWTYADVDAGEWVAVIGSGDTVELSVRDGDAAGTSGMRVGEPVVVKGSSR